MGTLPHHNCPCWRLTEPLSGDDTLPDHICPETMRGTVHTAIRDGVLPECKWWPARAASDEPLGPLTVLFVLRQWAEDGPSEALARLLAREYGWGQLVLGVQAGSDGRLHDDAGLAARLRHFGLPETPSTIRHLRAVAAGSPQSTLPTRGVLVTTLVRTHPPHTFTVSGELDTTTAALFGGPVAGVTIRHSAFAAEQVGKARYSSLRRVNIDAGRPARMETEYAAAAWEERDMLAVRRGTHPDGDAAALTEYLNGVAKRVWSRRRRAGLPTKAPEGWRGQVRPRLWDVLRSDS
jgi:hypothetical protein